jgi:class 3 adenylate cyclase
LDSLLRQDIPQELTEDSVDHVLALVERLRKEKGEDLDESAIQAVAELTSAPIEYVRLAAKLRVEKEKQGFFASVRAQFLTLGPATRRYVFSGLAAAMAALFGVIGNMLDQATRAINGSSYAVFGMLALLSAGLALYNISLSRESRAAAISGGIFGGGYYLMSSLFSMILQVHGRYDEWMLVPFVAFGAIAATMVYKVIERNRAKWGLKDPYKDRQELLRELVDLQNKLRSGEQSMTFVSFDVVGSTRMKQSADPLSVEFTFNEYHEFVERIVRKHRGSVHSTAGDGIICAFSNPSDGFAAARNVQAELIELNTFRNKIGTPLVLRAGVHTGTVVAPDATDASSVNYAHVIDIAAHLEKVCPPGGIAVSSDAALLLQGGMDAVGAQRVRSMDVEAAVWLPRQALAVPAIAPPALPEGA